MILELLSTDARQAGKVIDVGLEVLERESVAAGLS
jgi:hypothetical protein